MVQHKGNSNTELEDALTSCRKAARNGFTIAKKNLQETGSAIKGVADSISNCLISIKNGTVHNPEIVTKLKTQLSAIVTELESLQKTHELILEERRKNLDSFSITLFGRTMSGKSTLMEILTRGNGESIGIGSQRTTRDVRVYQWNGLEVTDVPGIAAFEGKEDESTAFNAVTKADLVLFLITDDAPQPVEAECLAQLCFLGKPVLGICNVKVAIDEEEDLLLFLRDPNRPFARTRIDQLLQQFDLLADQHIPGKRIPFVVTHLRSCFLAVQPGFERYREKLLRASRFNGVESCIVNEVVGRGTFLRVKSFIDGSVTPMMDLTNRLLEFSAQNSRTGRIFIDKRRQLKDWAHNFRVSGQKKINTLISKIMDSLRDEVPPFAEEHCENRLSGKKWIQIIESKCVGHKVKNLQKKFFNECKKAISEVSRELESELLFIGGLSSNFKGKQDPIFNTKRAWNWGTHILSSGLGIAALVFSSGPLGWAAAGVAVVGYGISLLLEDHEESVRKAREELSEQLFDDIDKMECDLQKNFRDWFHQELFKKQIFVLLDDLETVTSGLFKLADVQRTLAWTLNNGQKQLGHTLVKEALCQLDALDLFNSIVDVARVPGIAIMFLIESNTTFPEKIRNELKNLLGEQIWFVIDTKSILSILSQAIGKGCEKNKIKIEEKLRVAHVPLDDFDAVTKMRVRLAQQLTGFHIMK